MIISKIKGGLGNQLFQYALGRHVSHKNNEEFKIDISAFEKYKLHAYSLDYFNIKAKKATYDDLKYFKNPFFKKMGKIRPYYKRRIVFQQGKIFDKNILNTKNSYLIGYWQSEKFFLEIENIIRSDFKLKEEYQKEYNKHSGIITEMKNTDSIMLHVRRKDYITNPKTNKKHGLCSNEYYYKGIEYLSNRLKNPIVFIFSDDIQWAKTNLEFKIPHYFVDHGAEKNYVDLMLMATCKNAIIANSSFSWWGAWLNQNPEKIVIAPKKWFNNPEINTKDLIPKSWIRI